MAQAHDLTHGNRLAMRQIGTSAFEAAQAAEDVLEQPASSGPETLLGWVLAEVNPTPLERFEEIGTDSDELRYASWYPEQVDGRQQWALYGYVVRRGSYVQAAFFCDVAADREWALATWRSLR